MRTQSFAFIVCLFTVFGSVAEGGPAVTNEYRFVIDRSTVLQTGGVAGVEQTYHIEGRFVLTVDAGARTAAFTSVDANLIPQTEAWPRTLDDIFNLTALAGTIIDDTSIGFTGRSRDGSDVALTLVFQEDHVRLTGETTPPPNSADFFVFALDATAQRQPTRPSDRPRSGRYVFAPGRSTVTRTGGIAGMTKVYAVQGRFRLHVAQATGTASFVRVNARLVDLNGLEPARRLDEVFNLTGLDGTVGDDGSIRFAGRADDGSDVAIVLVFRNRRVHLTGTTTPPPNSADFFLFALDGLARRR